MVLKYFSYNSSGSVSFSFLLWFCKPCKDRHIDATLNKTNVFTTWTFWFVCSCHRNWLQSKQWQPVNRERFNHFSTRDIKQEICAVITNPSSFLSAPVYLKSLSCIEYMISWKRPMPKTIGQFYLLQNQPRKYPDRFTSSKNNDQEEQKDTFVCFEGWISWLLWIGTVKEIIDCTLYKPQNFPKLDSSLQRFW